MILIFTIQITFLEDKYGSLIVMQARLRSGLRSKKLVEISGKNNFRSSPVLISFGNSRYLFSAALAPL